MRRITTALLTVALALTSAPALAQDCQSLPVKHVGDSPKLAESTVDYEGDVRISIVGQFLWVEIEQSETVSVEVPDDTTSVTVCADGTVTLSKATHPIEIDEPDPEPETVNVITRHPEIFEGQVTSEPMIT